MIPDLIHVENALWPLLPPGIWEADLREVEQRFVYNPRRLSLFKGFRAGVENLFQAGCPQIFLDGSYVTAKPLPNDYEVCWDGANVNPDILDPVLLVFDPGRVTQKFKYGGEYFPAFWIEGESGKPFVDFFQKDKESGEPKGIIKIVNYLI